jgi:hypothetical protein
MHGGLSAKPVAKCLRLGVTVRDHRRAPADRAPVQASCRLVPELRNAVEEADAHVDERAPQHARLPEERGGNPDGVDG